MLQLPGRPRKDVVIQCSECGHTGRLPRKSVRSSVKPITVHPVSSGDSGPQNTTNSAPAAFSAFSQFAVIALLLLLVVGVSWYLYSNRTVENGQADANGNSEALQASSGIQGAATGTAGTSPNSNGSAADTTVLDTSEAAEASSAEKRRTFVSLAEQFRQIRRDLEDPSHDSAPRFLRYFTLTHLWNAGASAEDLQVVRQAFVKLVNSLSWQNEIYLPIPINADETIYRVDIRQLRWKHQTWHKIAAESPHAFSYQDSEAKRCQDLTGDSVFAVHADWFVDAASRSPLYETILELPDTLSDTAKMLRVDIDRNLKEGNVYRAGFLESGEVKHNRVIERHRSVFGAFWLAYDFDAQEGQKDVFQYPLGPEGKDGGFQFDRNQAIFTLPNGMLAYLITDADGRRIPSVPAAHLKERNACIPDH